MTSVARTDIWFQLMCRQRSSMRKLLCDNLKTLVSQAARPAVVRALSTTIAALSVSLDTCESPEGRDTAERFSR